MTRASEGMWHGDRRGRGAESDGYSAWKKRRELFHFPWEAGSDRAEEDTDRGFDVLGLSLR